MTSRYAIAGGSIGAVLAFAVLQLGGSALAAGEDKPCAQTDSGITLPKGFCATVFADKIGHARQMAVAPDGTVFVNTWSGVYYNNDTPPDGGFLVALKANKGQGKADQIERFGETFAEGGHGGTGIAIHKDRLYAEINDRIVRYALKDGEIAPTGKPETILSGMSITGDHPMHPFTIDKDGNLFVSMGSATNTCEVKNRMAALARQRSLHRARDAGRRLALRRQQDRPGLLAEGAVRLGHSQRRRLRLRHRRPPLRNAARPRSTARELAGALYGAAGVRSARRRGGDRQEGHLVRMAEMLFRRHAGQIGTCARIWRRRWQEGRRMRKGGSVDRGVPRALGAEGAPVRPVWRSALTVHST